MPGPFTPFAPLRGSGALRRLALVICVMATADAARAQGPLLGSQDSGRLLMRSFSAWDYQAHAQNWALVQAPDGLLYVGNGNGVLEYDGVTWRRLPLPNGTAVRALALDPEGRIYVGANGDFGVLAPDAQGRLAFVSLVDGVPEDERAFRDVWRVVVADDGVYFSARERLFRYAPDGRITSWAPDPMFALGFAWEGLFYTLSPTKGLLRVVGERIEPVPGGEVFANDIIFFALPRSDGSLLLGTRDRGLVRFRDGRLAPFADAANPELIRNLIYTATELPDGTLAVGTRQGGVSFFSPEGVLLRTLDHSSGLPGSQVHQVLVDREGGLWLALNKGLARLETRTPVTVFSEAAGVQGLTTAFGRYDGALYAATSAGVFRIVPGPGREPDFVPVIDEPTGQCLGLQATEAGLLVGCEMATFHLRTGHAPARVGPDTRALYVLPNDPTRALGAARDGTVLFRLENGAWRLDRRLEGFPAWSTSFHLDADGTLWMTSIADGIVRVHDFDGDSPRMETLGVDAGLPRGWTFAAEVAGRLVFHTREGVFRYDAPSGRFVRDEAITAALPNPQSDVLFLVEDEQGRVWFDNDAHVGLLVPGADGRYERRRTPLQRLCQCATFALFPDPATGKVWVSSDDGLLLYDPDVPTDVRSLPAAQVRRVATVGADSLLFGGFGEAAHVFAADVNALRFDFALPVFDGGASTYQVRLDGFDRDWSPWSAATSKDYTNLPPGTYVFRVRGRDEYGIESAEGTFAFRILPPWYQTWWARGLQALGLLLGLGVLTVGALHLRTRHLQTRNELLEREVQHRTRTLARANERLRTVIDQNSEFMSIAAHDLKNPLTSIIGFAEILLHEQAEDPDAVELLGLIRESALQMSGTVRQLQDTEALESGRLSLLRTRLDVGRLAEAVVRRIEGQARAKQIRLDLDAPEPALADVDEQYFPRVLENLVSNAVKFSPPESRVRVSVERRNGFVQIAVADQGPGLTAEDRQRAFSKLQRLSARPTGGESSTGLGLFIVHTLVTLHGGTVRIDSEPGHGATFIVTLAEAEPQPVDALDFAVGR